MMDEPGSTRHAVDTNRQRLLRILREHGPMHRAELARRAGLSRTTVSTAMEVLISEGLVTNLDGRGMTGEERPVGRPGRLLGIQPGTGSAIGVAFSYHEVRVILSDLAQGPLIELVTPLPQEQAPGDDLDIAANMIQQAIESSGISPEGVLGVGLGVPGPLDCTRGMAGSSSEKTWSGSMPADELAHRVGFPTLLDNTARLSLLAEARWGAGAGKKDVVFVKLSSGVGGGFLVDGRLLRGDLGAGGEIGHVVVEPGGQLCRCGGRGCLEAYASVPAVIAQLRPLLGPDIGLSEALLALAKGNPSVTRLFSDVGQLVGRAVANAVNLFNPQLVVIGGELAEAGPTLLQSIEQATKRESLPLLSAALSVRQAALGPRSAALGGIALVLREEDRLVRPGPRRSSKPVRRLYHNSVSHVTATK